MSEIQGTLDHISERLIQNDTERLESFEWS